MTDSMKFGPEWLRNLSAESLSNSGLGSTNIQPSTNNGIGLQSPGCSAPTRNMFPEFRYGREEMLSLFEKNCNIPEILPRYKSLFVEKVQYPLAMTPCTEDEVPIPTPAPTSGRPAWIQRSPVGFSTSMRGISRGGSVDRGRLRGKPVYHSGFQRTTPTFEDDSRPIPVKTDRNWAERNGEHLPTPAMGMEWNGTAVASPRREFPSHSRNLENWRRSRTDDVSNDIPSGGISTSNNEGWRTSTFGNSNRWGRSTSWREEDAPNDVGNQSGGFGGIQRSFSTLGSVNDRNCVSGHSNNSTTKSQALNKFDSHLSANNVQGVSSPINTAQNSNSGHGPPEWSGGQGGNISSTDFDDNLPEWATESASDIGGTFDATGAFHGTIQAEECTNTENQNKNQPNNLSSDKSDNVMKTLDKMNNLCNLNQIDSKNSSQATFTKDSTDQVSQVKSESNVKYKPSVSEEYLQNKNCVLSNVNSNNKNNKTKKEESLSKISDTICRNDDTLNAKDDFKFGSDINPKPLNTDISDQMKEVTNNMIEKLIMDDDCGINSNIVNSSRTPKSFASVGASIFKQPGGHQQITSEADVLPQPITSNVGQKPNTIYCGDVGNHNAIQQHDVRIQKSDIITAKVVGITQPQIMGAVHESTDLWYYRDPQSKVQGPFTAAEMTEWYRAGYFNENLFVRRICDTRFRALGELITICNGNVPFTHSHMLPLDLDSVSMNNPMIFNDFVLNSQQNEQCEELKGNVTAAADSLSHAVKSVISSVDVSQMLNMHFQMLQDQYIRHQEMAIVTELSKNEGFQRLSAHEKESVVRQKVQLLILPDYLSSLAGLRNSLAILNPTAGIQLYDAIAECSRKDNNFSSACQSPHLQQINTSSPVMSGDDLGRNASIQNQSQVKYATLHYSPGLPSANECEINVNKVTSDSENATGNNLLNEFNLRMMLAGGHINTLSAPQNKIPEFISPNDSASRVDFKVDQQMSSTSGQSPLIHMWMPTSNNNNNLLQHQMVTPQANNNQWPDGLLVNISNTQVEPVLETTSLRQSIWNATNADNSGNHVVDRSPPNPSITNEQGPSLDETKKYQIKRQDTPETKFKEIYDSSPKPISSGSEDLNKISSLSATSSSKPEKISTQNSNTNKKNKTNNATTISSKIKDEGLFVKRNEEERRREALEDKRRQKEERKRLQVEEEKRRIQIVEDEKKRQLQEEKERQLLIQNQRRKALLGSNSPNSVGGNVLTSKNTKDSQVQTRIQTSIAPWSMQSTGGSTDSGPGLAEIQKAERRERRADQQRQTEMTIKANANVVAESTDAVLKWNASPLPVKSFAEIQAEEAKRLAAENIELQRRKEQEQLALIAAATNLTSVNTSNHMSNIWVGSKVWSSPNTSIFWEDNTKYNTTATGNGSISASGVSASLSLGAAQQNSLTLSNTSAQQTNVGSNRNLRKSQTVSVMQNSATKNTVVQPDKNTNNLKKVQTKPDSPDNKKNGGKKTISIEHVQTNNNQNEFEKEFTSWCTKYLNNMNTIVDVPTFVTFLQDLESPYEVKDYIRMYLGESKESTDFAKQFLERRNRYKNLQRAQNAHNDDMCKPAPALTPSANDHNDNKGKQKKVKKSKMTKLDARILGFSVTAAEGRINVGDRDYVDGP